MRRIGYLIEAGEFIQDSDPAEGVLPAVFLEVTADAASFGVADLAVGDTEKAVRNEVDWSAFSHFVSPGSGNTSFWSKQIGLENG